jgi:heptosyltransferase II
MDLKTLQPRKILVINPFGIGDVLFTTPVLMNLRRAFPGAIIGYIGNRRTAPLLEAHQAVDKVFIYERDDFDRLYKTSRARFVQEMLRFIQSIREERYDVVFDFSLNPMINALTWLIRIPYRFGYNYKNRGRFLTMKIPFPGFEGRHVVEHYLGLLEEVGVPATDRQLTMNIPVDDRQWALNYLGGSSTGRLRIGMFPGAGASWGANARFRRWGVDNYALLTDKIVAKWNAQIILMGDSSEKNLCAKIASRHPDSIVPAFARTSLTQLTALISFCDVVVLNDGGPLHIAVAVGAKSVSIFGPVDHQVYGPWGNTARHRVVTADIFCRPCYRRFRMSDCEHVSCLSRIHVNDVFEQLEALL